MTESTLLGELENVKREARRAWTTKTMGAELPSAMVKVFAALYKLFVAVFLSLSHSIYKKLSVVFPIPFLTASQEPLKKTPKARPSARKKPV